MTNIKAALNNRSMDELIDLATRLAKSNNDLLWALIHARKEAGFTQSEVAAIMDITQPTVAAFESEDNDPRLSTISRYALAIGASVSHHVSTPCGTDHFSDGWVGVSLGPGFSYGVAATQQESPQVPYDSEPEIRLAA